MSGKIVVNINIGTPDNVKVRIKDFVDSVSMIGDGMRIFSMHKSIKGKLKHHLGEKIFYNSHSINIDGARIDEVDKYGVIIFAE